MAGGGWQSSEPEALASELERGPLGRLARDGRCGVWRRPLHSRYPEANASGSPSLAAR